jgi:membrane dipeptidase
MSMRRRDFVKLAGVTALGAAPLKGFSGVEKADGQIPLEDQGRHPVLEKDHPYVFIDSCMQIWPDADLASAHRHGVTTYAVTAWDPHIPVDQALEGLMYWRWVARTYPNISVAETTEDILQAKKQGRTSLLLASQCGDFIDYELHRIEAFYRLGLRMLIPAYSADNRICGGCLDRADTGLSAFGEKVVEECNRVGLLLDCSHLSRRSSLEIIDRSRHPVVFSHSGAKALADNPRNIDDVQIRACAERGGIVGLSPWGPMVLRKGQTARPTREDFIRHIDHVAQMLGSADHIGIGTDMSLGTYPDHAHDPWGDATYRDVTGAYNEHVTDNIRSPRRMVEGFSFFPEVLNLAGGLKKRGYGEADIRRILGGNYLRVFREVWS